MKENLSPDEVAVIKGASRELLENLKPLLVPHWRDFETNRAEVKVAITNLLFIKLPEPAYTENDCEMKGFEVYNFVYESYHNERVLTGVC